MLRIQLIKRWRWNGERNEAKNGNELDWGLKLTYAILINSQSNYKLWNRRLERFAILKLNLSFYATYPSRTAHSPKFKCVWQDDERCASCVGEIMMSGEWWLIHHASNKKSIKSLLETAAWRNTCTQPIRLIRQSVSWMMSATRGKSIENYALP